MKVGDYVRTKYGTIGKIKKFQKGQVIDIRADNKHIFSDEYYDLMILYGGECIMVNKEEYKHSPFIIDLIEEDDYVNGERITSIGYDYKGDKIIGYYIPSDIGEDYFKEEDIKFVVTREQFKRMEYEVK